jgi:hypothetical protein
MHIKNTLHFIKCHTLPNLTKIRSLAFTVTRVPAKKKAMLTAAVHGFVDNRLMDTLPL